MKSTMIMAVLLMGLVLSMGFSSAIGINANAIAKVKANQKALSIGEIESESESELEAEFDIKQASANIDKSLRANAREITFAQVSIGSGWSVSSSSGGNSSEGDFVRIFWVEKTFVTSGNGSNSTNQTNQTETTKASGTLKIGSNLYKLTLSEEKEDMLVFDVTSQRAGINGTLELEAETSLPGFTIWTGHLDMESGTDYDIYVATKNSKIKGSDAEIGGGAGMQGNLNAAERGQGNKIGLWARIRAYFGGE